MHVYLPRYQTQAEPCYYKKYASWTSCEIYLYYKIKWYIIITVNQLWFTKHQSRKEYAMNDFINSLEEMEEVNYYDTYSGESFDSTEYTENYNEYKEAENYD